jgi:hypothetical protein
MRTQDLERAIAQCKKFFVSPIHGRAVYEYDDIRAVMIANKVAGVEKVTNGIMGRMIGRFGGFVLHQSKIGDRLVSTVQATPERIDQLRKLVSQYVDKPSKNNGKGFEFKANPFPRKAKF